MSFTFSKTQEMKKSDKHGEFARALELMATARLSIDVL
jgi:hypothetical protein